MAKLNRFSDFNWQLLLNTRRDLLLAIAFGLTTLILIILTYNQTTNALATNRQLKKENDKIAQLDRKVQELAQLKFSPEFAQAEQINRVLPLEVLNNLNSVAGETRVSITEFEINPGEIASDSTQVDKTANQKKIKSDYDQLDLELTVVGPLPQVRMFMDLIERVSPLTTINSLTIDRKVNDPLIENATRADLSLSAYYYTKPISSTLSSALPIISEEEKRVFQAILEFSPTKIEGQTTIISGNNDDLFGIQGLTVTNLEETLGLEELTE